MTASLETRLALIDLTARYAQAVDRRDQGALAALFTADAVLVQPAALARRNQNPELHGNDAIATGLLEAVSHLRATHHVVAQQVIAEQVTDTLDGADTARGETYCTAHHIYARHGDIRDNSLAIRYRDTFQRTTAGWRIARRELYVDFADDRPVTQPG